jgi:hypothetical protein
VDREAGCRRDNPIGTICGKMTNHELADTMMSRHLMKSPYSTTYAEARAQFIEAARAANAILGKHELSQLGPAGEELATDTAWVGPTTANRVLVTTSATHGVEGLFGSATQVEWLRRTIGEKLPPDVAALHIHAINPYGFAWLRRTNEDNVDINRNWIDFEAPLPSNRLYEELSNDLCPTDWSESTQGQTLQRLMAWIEAHKFAKFKKGVTEGQHTHPHGLFFSGLAPSWSRNTLTRILRTLLSNANRVCVIDFHTGLGPYGYVEPIIGQPRSDPAFDRTRTWIGASARSLFGDGSVSAEIKGDCMSILPSLLPRAVVDCVALECGVRPEFEVLHALRADAWLHAHGDPRSAQGKHISDTLKGVFHSDDLLWQGMALGQGLAACRAAVSFLSEG